MSSLGIQKPNYRFIGKSAFETQVSTRESIKFNLASGIFFCPTAKKVLAFLIKKFIILFILAN